MGRLLQQRAERADDGEGPAQVGAGDLVENLVGQGVQIGRRHHHGAAGGVDQDIGAAETLRHGLGRRAHARALVDRDLRRHMVAWRQSGDDALGRGAVAMIADDDARAVGGEQSRRRLADAAAGAGHHHNSAGKIVVRRHY